MVYNKPNLRYGGGLYNFEAPYKMEPIRSDIWESKKFETKTFFSWSFMKIRLENLRKVCRFQATIEIDLKYLNSICSNWFNNALIEIFKWPWSGWSEHWSTTLQTSNSVQDWIIYIDLESLILCE